jgi:hypothetical protein
MGFLTPKKGQILVWPSSHVVSIHRARSTCLTGALLKTGGRRSRPQSSMVTGCEDSRMGSQSLREGSGSQEDSGGKWNLLKTCLYVPRVPSPAF